MAKYISAFSSHDTETARCGTVILLSVASAINLDPSIGWRSDVRLLSRIKVYIVYRGDECIVAL